MKSKMFIPGLLILILAFVSSCNESGKQSKKVGTLSSEKIDIKKVKEDIVDIIVSLPDSYETVKLINESGAAYIAGLTQEGMSTVELLTRADKAKTYGFVMFDLAYANTYNQTSSFTKLLELHKKLTQDLGYESLVAGQKKFEERYLANRENRDSVDQIVSEMLNETNSYIQQNGSAADISLVFAGVTAKSLFVMSNLTLFAMNNEKLVDLLKKQKDRIDAAINILGMVTDDNEVQKMAEFLAPVKAVYAAEVFDVTSVEKIQEATRTMFE